MNGKCDRCQQTRDIGSLVKLTKGWGGRRTGVTVCYSCIRSGECGDSASD